MSVLLLLSDSCDWPSSLHMPHQPGSGSRADDDAIEFPRGCNRCILLVRETLASRPLRWVSTAYRREQVTIIPHAPNVRGSACIALLACGEIDDGELVILDLDAPQPDNHDQFLTQLRTLDCDGGVGVFASHDPRWPHVRLDDAGRVEETTTLSTVTDHALAGVYYFRNGSQWVEAAKDLIRKDRHESGHFHLAATINELILMGRHVVALPLRRKTTSDSFLVR